MAALTRHSTDRQTDTLDLPGDQYTNFSFTSPSFAHFFTYRTPACDSYWSAPLIGSLRRQHGANFASCWMLPMDTRASTSWGRVGAWRQGLASGGRGQQGRKRTCSSSSNTCSAYTFSSTCNHEPKIGTTPALDDMALLRRRFTGGAEHGSLPVALCPSQGPGVRLLALLMGSRREARVWRRRHGLQRRLLLLIVPAAWADPAE